jgi:hypothetical protein
MFPSGSFEDYCDRVYIGTDSKYSYATRAMPLIPVLELRFISLVGRILAVPWMVSPPSILRLQLAI